MSFRLKLVPWLGNASPLLFAVTMFVSAFLLFQVQPLMAKFLLPWFGGAQSVWVVCMLFFQSVLIVGYWYAHALIRCFTPRSQAAVHSSILLASLAFVPISPDATGQPWTQASPTAAILLLLGLSVGVPYFLLSATSTLLQSWLSRLKPEGSPYRLYAVSNLGSLLGLLAYPLLVEPLWPTSTQGVLWSWGYTAFLLFVIGCAGWTGFAVEQSGQAPAAVAANKVDRRENTFLWFALPAVASLLLLSVTNHLCQDIAPIPLLWVVPFSLYLLSFILCFESDRFYRPRVNAILFCVGLPAVCLGLYAGRGLPLTYQILCFNGFLFIACMACHGELAKRKPQPGRLSAFYLAVSLGGAAGGVFTGILAPLLFKGYWELHIGIFASALLLYGAYWFETAATRDAGLLDLALKGAGTVGVGLLGGVLYLQALLAYEDATFVSRNFFGVVQVTEPHRSDRPPHRALNYGNIIHGMQFLTPGLSSRPTGYYTETAGVGRGLDLFKDRQDRRIGVIGLGVATLAAYGKTGDTLRFYEINPDVIAMAKDRFSFLSGGKAVTEIVAGDALLSMRSEAPQHYTLLALDAFSGDAVPMHLLTREAFALYLEHLAPDGIIAAHISNKYLDLRPILWGIADHFGLETALLKNDDEPASLTLASTWMLLSRKPESLAALRQAPGYVERDRRIRTHLWTFDFGSSLAALRLYQQEKAEAPKLR